MARQSITQHLDVLVDAGLVIVVRHGRERLHYLNPVPIQEISDRWIAAYEAPRLAAVLDIKHRAEDIAMTENAAIPEYVYVTYIRATAEQVWQALTDADLTARYWGHANVSDWAVGSSWEHRRVDGSGTVDLVGSVLASEPPNHLRITFDDSSHELPNGPSVVDFRVEPHQDIVRLTVTHTNLPDAGAHADISRGWPAVLANLKSLLETGDVLPVAPWEMPERV